MGYPNKKEIERARLNLKSKLGTLMLGPNPTALEKFRWDLCQGFVKYKIKEKCTSKQLAEILAVDEAKVSKILHHRIDEFSTDRLIALYQIIHPKLALKVG